MKHLFVVHSNITYLAALGIICKEKIPIDDVILVSENYYLKSPIEVNQVKQTDSKIKLIFRLRELFCPVLSIDRTINNLTDNQEYIAYVPMLLFFSKVIITNPFCKGFNFIEDGLAAYTDNFSFDFLQQLYMKSRTRLGFSFKDIKQRCKDAILAFTGRIAPKIVAIPLYYNSFVGIDGIACYGFNEFSHVLNNQVNQVISFSQIIQRFPIETEYNFTDSVIWIGENCVNTYDYPLSDYLDAINKGLINYLYSKNIAKVYVKFHPHEHSISKEGTLSLLKSKGIEVCIIENKTIMELELMKSNNVILFGTYSTLLLYGALMGHMSYSVCKYLRVEDNYFTKILAIPQSRIFWERVIQI